jgi:hypothetical protein
MSSALWNKSLRRVAASTSDELYTAKKIGCDQAVLFEVWSLKVLNQPGPTLETVLASDDELGIGEDWV